MAEIPFLWLAAGLFGLLIGSFLNVCIYRWPRDLSVNNPRRSFCPSCERQIPWFENIPLLSYLTLRGRCSGCKSTIHWRYPAVELLTALIFAWLVYHHGPNAPAVKLSVFAAMVIALGFSDLETRLLPDELTLGGTVIGLAFSLITPVGDGSFQLLAGILGFRPTGSAASFGDAVFGAFFCSGSIWCAGWLFEKLRKKEGLGFGDVKMLAMTGAFLGFQRTLLTIIVGSLLGSIAGLTYIRLTGKDAGSYQLPFGSFLALAALIVALAGSPIISWYVQTL